MMRRIVLTAIVAIAPVVLASSAAADERATLVLRSGERVDGRLVDLNRSGFTVRSSGGRERQFDMNQVARIEFRGEANLPSGQQMRGGEHAFVMTDGSVIYGRLYDIGGTQPLRVSIETSSGKRDLRSSDIRSIHLVDPTTVGGTATAGSSLTVPEGAGIAVPANQQWVDTGIIVRRGQRVRFSAQGEAQLSTDPKDRAIPQGSLTGRRPANGPLPDILAGALIARVGEGQPFAISNFADITMNESGRLMLGVNDDVVNDNTGGFRVEVTPQGRR